MSLTAQSISFERSLSPLFADLTIAVTAGELLQVQGANGSGKSTLLRIFAGLLEPHEGLILWDDQPISEIRAIYQRNLQYVGHLNGIRLQLTCLENLKLHGVLNGILLKETELMCLLDKVGLKNAARIPAIYLSAGQKRRVSLARLLIHYCPLWILDEPITALDDTGQALLIELINQQLSKGGMVILATHQLLPIRAMKTLTIGNTIA